MEDNLVKRPEGLNNNLKLKEVLIPAGIILAIILAGGATGYFLTGRGAISAAPTSTQDLIGGAQRVQGPNEVGIKDEKTFKDTAEGRIEVNDNSDVPEGSHILIRSGGSSQTVYITSSVVNLDQFLGKCVQVKGRTFAGQKAGWLMDIGWVKILDSCPKGLD